MRLTMATRLYILVGIFFLGLVTLALILNYQFSSNLRTQKNAELTNLVTAATNVVKSYDEQVKAGKLTMEQAQLQAANAVRAMRYQGKEYFFIIDDKGTMLMHAVKPALHGKNLIGLEDPHGFKLFAAMVEITKAKGAGFVSYMWSKAGSDIPVDKLSFVKAYKPWNWIIGTGVYMDNLNAILWSTTQLILMVGGMVLSICIGFALLTLRSILPPMLALKETMMQLANGKEVQDIPAIDRKDELGDMAQTVAVFKDMTDERQRLDSERLENQKIQQTRQLEVETMINSFRKDVTQELEVVTNNMESMRQTADELSNLSQSAATRSGEAQSAITEASENVQTVAAASEEFSASISEINRQVDQATEVVKTAIETTDNAGKKISSLAEAAQQIGDVITLIQDIAEQTNLLALNATIEAARAGELGKGFAVVAAEVKGLSNQTSKATELIGKHISTIQASTTDAVDAIKEIGSTIDQVNSYTSSISEAIQQQAQATSEISSSIAKAALKTEGVIHDMEAVSDSVSETNNAVIEVKSVSDNVYERAESLSGTVDVFLEEVAAA